MCTTLYCHVLSCLPQGGTEHEQQMLRPLIETRKNNSVCRLVWQDTPRCVTNSEDIP